MRTGILGFVRLDTSFGEASSRTQATDPNRRETLRIRTPLPGLRGEAKWLAAGIRFEPGGRSTPWSAKALTREVRPGISFSRTFVSSGVTRLVPAGSRARRRCGLAPPCVATEGRQAMDSDSPGRSRPFSLLSHSVPGTRRLA